MRMTHNQALDVLAAGNEEKAFVIAMQDEGIRPDTKKNDWLVFAYKCLENRKNF